MSTQIVVVEDSRDIRELLQLLLESEGFDVRSLAHPRSIESLDPRAAPGAFLIDLMLPGTSGVELARRIRELGFVETPIIAISASRLMLEVARGSGLFADFIYKPFDLAQIVECLGTATASHPGPGVGPAATPHPTGPALSSS
jgi:two-component system phosphate regulon response regulator PhoB